MSEDTMCMSAVGEAPKEIERVYTSSVTPMKGHWESWVEGPKFAQLPEFIGKMALIHKLKVTRLDVMSRFLRETVFFRVEGNYDDVIAFQNGALKAFENR